MADEQARTSSKAGVEADCCAEACVARKPTRLLTFWLVRLVVMGVVVAVVLALVYPGGWVSSRCSVVAGPMLLLETQSASDNSVGLMMTVVLSILIFSVALRPCLVTAAFSLFGMVVWVVIGWLICAASSI